MVPDCHEADKTLLRSHSLVEPRNDIKNWSQYWNYKRAKNFYPTNRYLLFMKNLSQLTSFADRIYLNKLIG